MTLPARSAIIELFGTPGAGKSTLARAAADGPDLGSSAALTASWKRLPRIRKAALVTSAFLHPAAVSATAQLALRAPLANADALVRLARLLPKSRRLRLHRDQLLLLQEGLLQDLWSILYSAGRTEPDRASLMPVLRQIYAGLDVRVVHIDVDAGTAFERIRMRAEGASRFDRFSEAELRRQLGKTAQLARTLAAVAVDAGLPVETLDGAAPIPVNAARLKAIVAQAAAGSAQSV